MKEPRAAHVLLIDQSMLHTRYRTKGLVEETYPDHSPAYNTIVDSSLLRELYYLKHGGP